MKITDSKITLSWEVVPLATNYSIEMKGKGTSSWKVAAENIADTTYTVENLKTGEEINFRVIALCETIKSVPGPSERFLIEGIDFIKFRYSKKNTLEGVCLLSKRLLQGLFTISIFDYLEPFIRAPLSGCFSEFSYLTYCKGPVRT